MTPNILIRFFPNTIKELIYFTSAPVGIVTYSLVVMLGPKLVVPLIVSITAGMAVNGLFLAMYMYIPTEARKNASKFDTLQLIFAYYLVLIAATFFSPTNYDAVVVVLYCGLLFLLMFHAINSESPIKLAVTGIFAGALNPLMALILVYIPSDYFILPLVIITLLIIIKLIQKQAPGYYFTLTSQTAFAGLMQFPLFCFALIDLFLYEYFDHETLAIYLVKWRVIYGFIVFLFAKVMIKLAFDANNAGSLNINIKVAAFLFLLALCLSTYSQVSLALDFLLIVIALLINQVSVIIRTYIKNGIKFLPSVVNFLLSLTILAFVVNFFIPSFSESSDPRFIFSIAVLVILLPSILILPVSILRFSK